MGSISIWHWLVLLAGPHAFVSFGAMPMRVPQLIPVIVVAIDYDATRTRQAAARRAAIKN